MRNWRLRFLTVAVGALVVGLTSLALADTPIATTDGETSAMQLQIVQFKRSGSSVMLRFTIINNSDTAFLVNGTLTSSCCHVAVDGVYLIDLANKKKYEVVTDADKKCVCSRDFGDIAPKASVNLWAKFPAPPDNVQKMGIVVPHFIPMDDVPLSQ
jgi:hypothetical protein